MRLCLLLHLAFMRGPIYPGLNKAASFSRVQTLQDVTVTVPVP
eukprot:SAG31_NODE_32975_length_349_cov_1.036000_2_plen_42_part_01